ncbi:sulfatase/phosphatase domain-containing protein, partial [Rhizobiaceae sp. 2RAB30]
GKDGAVDTNAPYSGLPQPVEEQLKHLDRIGTRHGGAHYPQGWAMAGNTPFRRYKQHVDLGGVRSPMVVSWPRGIAAAGEVRGQFSHVIDLAPTIMSLAGLEHPLPCDGRSLESTFDDGEAPAPRATQYWENLGHRAIWHEGWRAVTEHRQGVDYEDDDWRLYDTETDFSEAHDRAAGEPELLREMVGRWWQEAEANNVLPLDDRSLVQLLRARPPIGLMSRDRLVFRPGQSHIPISSMITGSERSMRVVAAFRDRMADEEGVLVSSGDSRGGYVLYVKHGRLVFEHVQLGQRTICIADAELPAGTGEAGFVLHA